MSGRGSARIHQVETFDLFRLGELDACLMLAREHGLHEVEARTLMRLGRHQEAAIVAGEHDDDPFFEGLRAQCLTVMGDEWRAEQVLSRWPFSSGTPAGRGSFEIAYAHWQLAWVRRDRHAMDAAIHRVSIADLSPTDFVRFCDARAWTAASSGQYVEQVRFLERCVRKMLDDPDAYDAFMFAKVAQALSHFARELYTGGSFELLKQMLDRIVWTKNLESLRVLTLRAMAWSYALRGDAVTALRLMYDVRDAAPISKRVLVGCDLAYLARMASESASAQALLEYATDIALNTEAWKMSIDEDRVGLLNLIELNADVDVPAARRLWQRYQEIPAPIDARLSLADDRRMRAMESYASGCLFASEGRTSAALTCFTDAFETFSKARYAWRAAAAALRLNRLTGEPQWLDAAREAVVDFPRSSVAIVIRKMASGTFDERYERLTLTQRKVFRDLCKGFSDREIADEHGIRRLTASNHVAAIRKSFGVKSRNMLIVEGLKLGIA